MSLNPQRLYARYPKIEEAVDPNEVTLLGILYTDGCLSKKGKNSWCLYLSNTSWSIIKAFKESLMKLYDLPEERIRISRKIVNGKPFYKAVVDSSEIGQILTQKYGTFRTLKYRCKVNESFYPPASLPIELANDLRAICKFLQVAFSCDGGVNLYVAHNKYRWLIRNVYLACQHPTLRKQYQKLLWKIGIAGKILEKDDLVRIQDRENLEKFARKVGFMKGVKITQNSAYWQDWQKQKVLELAIASYGNPRIVLNLPQFRGKEIVRSPMRIGVNTNVETCVVQAVNYPC